MRTSFLLCAAALSACTAEPPAGDSRGEALPPLDDGTTVESAKPASAAPEQPPRNETGRSACRIQDGRQLPAVTLRAIGTEPFWGARINGRCVTYSHPEDQAGTRIWTRFSGTAEAGSWTGFYQNQRFVLRTHKQEGCSDGMSDRRYPIAVDLTIGTEQRSGCAQAL